MSIKTWKEEFYSTPAADNATTPLKAAKHSLKKWKGFAKENLAKHDLTWKDYTFHGEDGRETMLLHGEECALCHFGESEQTEQKWQHDIEELYDGICDYCPLYQATGQSCESVGSTWRRFLDGHEPDEMIANLEKAIKHARTMKTLTARSRKL